MARIEFGNTWWGEKWLEALTSTDYSNRLPRGKSYARNGYVKSVSIDKDIVNAQVRGSRRTPYKVELGLAPFSKKEQETILDIITKNPLYLSALLTKKLPPELYDEFTKHHIKIFPKNWNDVTAGCSCPDWAECCKHIASIIYMIANEIDRNPFLIFQLHNFDIFKALEKRGFKPEDTKTSSITSVDKLFIKTAPKKKWNLDKTKLKQIDFSNIPILNEQLLSLLTNKPLFSCKKDFKQTLGKAYKNFSKQAFRLAQQTEAEGLHKENTETFTQIEATISEDLVLSKITITSDTQLHEARTLKDLLHQIIPFLQSIPAKKLPYHHEKLIALYMMFHFSIKLLEQGAFIPEILSVKKHFKIRWIPALLNDSVKQVFEKIMEITPPDILKVSGKKKLHLSKEEQVKNLLSFFLSAFIQDFSTTNREFYEEEIAQIFFKGQILKTSQFEQKELPNTISLWLSRFYITHKDFVPLVKVEEERGNEFSIEVLAENRKKELEEPIPFKKILTQKKYERIKFDVLKDCTLLAEQFPEINTFLNSGGTEKLMLSVPKFTEVFFKHLPALKLLGIPILLPKGLDELVRPKISVSVKKSGSTTTKSYLSLDDMLEFNWQIALGDTFVSPEEFKKLVLGSSGIVKLKDQFVYLDEKEIQKILNNLEKDSRLSPQDKLRTILADEYNGAKIELDKAVQELIEYLFKIEKIKPPKTLKAELRHYQQNGYEWLYKNAQIGFGSLIADDMGLGKTIQIITTLLQMKSEKRLKDNPALVVVPTTLLTNWTKEIEKFGPSLKSHTYHGADRKLEMKSKDIVLTTYGLVRSDLDLFQSKKWSAIIIDEAQNIKNPDTAQTKAVKKLKSDIRIAMTGTPVENRLTEYWSIFDFLNKGYLNNISAFKKEFALPIEIDRDQKKLEQFKRITSPFLLRRLKNDKSIIKDLPDKVESDQFCHLNKSQSALYQNVMDKTMKVIEGTEEGIAKKGLVLKLITSLKQICNHPSHFLKKKDLSVDLSGKTEMLMELLKTIYENEEKVLIFTQYTEMGNLLEKMIQEAFNSEVLFLHGGVSRKKRDEMVDRFQEEPYLKSMILSLKAGGTGLNLTQASNVIHFDLWWNPAVEAQATDRAYRIGQKKNVMVHRLITKGTFEEKIDQMIKDKKELANMAVSKGEKWIGEFSNTELREMFKLG